MSSLSSEKWAGWKIFRRNLSLAVEEDEGKKKDFAQRVGVDASSVSAWLAGRRFPSVPQLFAIGKALGCSIDKLFDRVPGDPSTLNRTYELVRGLCLSLESILPEEHTEERERRWQAQEAKRKSRKKHGSSEPDDDAA